MKHTDLPQNTVERKMAVDNCILFQKCGSVAYGTNIKGKSDEDYMGVFIPDDNYCFGLKNIEQVEFRTNDTGSGKKNTAEDMDCTLYSLPKFVKLLLNNNPNTLESLYYPENCRIYMNEYGKMLIDNKDIFISKKSYHSFKGYSFSQISRLNRGETKTTGRIDLIEKFGFDTKMFSHAVRLYLECNELLSTGNITLPLKENNMVLTIKRGEWSKERCMEEAKKLETLCDSLYVTSKLQNSPNQEKAHQLLMNMQKKFYGYGKEKNVRTWRELTISLLRSIANHLED